MAMYKDKILHSGMALFLLNMLASMLNYVCQILMARVLSVEIFGMVNTIFSFLLLTGVLGSTLTMVVSKYYAELRTDSCVEERIEFMSEIFRFCSVLAGIVFTTCVILIKPLSHALAINDVIVLLLSFGLGATGFYQPMYAGVFSGTGHFVLVGMYSLLIPLYKMISVVVAELFSKDDVIRLYCILIVMLLGTIATAFVGHRKTVFIFGKISFKGGVKKTKISLSVEEMHTLLLNICLMLYMNIDLLAVRHYGSEVESGLYSSVLLFGRIMYYFSMTLGTMLLPMAVAVKGKKQERIKILNRTLGCMVGFSVLCIVPVNLFGEFFIEILFGNAYVHAYKYIKYISLISVALSVSAILIHYLVGIGQTKLAVRFMMGVNAFILVLLMIEERVEVLLTGIGVTGIIGAALLYLIGVCSDNIHRH